MAARIGKCTNYSGCKLAYRNEKISVVTKDFRCPECGSPLESIDAPKSSSLIWVVAGGVFIFLLLAIFAVVWTLFRPKPKPRLPSPSPTPIVTPTAVPSPTVWTPTPTPTLPLTPTPEPATPTPPPPDMSAVQKEVLQRVDIIPDLSDEDKDRLYVAVKQAKDMKRLFNVTFETSRDAVGPREVGLMKVSLAQPEVIDFLKNPTLVIVVLGFADKVGDVKKNLALSQTRAKAVEVALVTECGVKNIIHSVPMGGSDLLSTDDLAKNRVVEVWAVIP
ncbi:MAG TPA: OmpA family protein [Chthoniobacterales bacterium]